MPNQSPSRAPSLIPTQSQATRRRRQKLMEPQPITAGNHEPAFTRAWRSFCSDLQGHSSPDAAHVDHLRELCRAGDPFPLIAHQWPDLIIVDPDEAKFFEGELHPDPDSGKPHPAAPCLRIDHWQRKIIRAFFTDDIGEVFIKGATKAGKGAAIGIAANLYFDCYDPCRIFLTSQRYDHAVANVFGEIRMWRKWMYQPGPGILLAAGIGDHERHYVAILNPDQGEGFSGQHGPRTCFIFDEASSIRDEFYLDSQKQAERIIALANPRTLSGWFRDGFRPLRDPDATEICDGAIRKRLCVTVGGQDCLNVSQRRLAKPFGPRGGIEIDPQKKNLAVRTFEHNQPIPQDYWKRVKPLIPNQIDYARFLDILATELPLRIPVFAHGKFPTEDPELQVILSSWLFRHEQAWRAIHERGEKIKVNSFGLDVARSIKGCESILAAGGYDGCEELHAEQYADVVVVGDWTLRTVYTRYGIDLRLGQHPVCVDMDGLGAGTGDWLRKQNVWVIEHRGNATSETDPRTYGNMRAEAYGTLGRRLNPDDLWRDTAWALPPDQMLREELIAPEKIYGANDSLRFILMKKEDVAKKLNPERSPDRGDAVAMLYRAVRTLHNIDQWMLDQARDLVCWPAWPVTVNTDDGRRDRIREGFETEKREDFKRPPKIGEPDFDWAAALSGFSDNGQNGSNGHHDNRNGHPPAAGSNGSNGEMPPEPVNQQIDDLLAWAKEESGWAEREFGR